MTTITNLRQDKWFTAIFLPILALLLLVGLIFGHFKNNSDRVIIGLIVVFIEALLGYGIYKVIVSWNNSLSFEQGSQYLLIRNNSSAENKVALTDIVGIDVGRGRMPMEIIKYRLGTKVKKYSFIPYATPEIKAWHQFVRKNRQFFDAVMSPGAKKLHNDMDEQLVSDPGLESYK